MDKNSVTGLVLIALILGVFYFINQPSEEQKAAQQRYQDSLRQVEIAAQAEALTQQNIQNAGNSASEQVANIADSLIEKDLESKYGIFSNAAKGEASFYTLENEKVKITFSNKGAKVYSVELKEFKTFDGKPLVLFDGDKNVFGFSFFNDNRPIQTDNLFYSVDNSATNDSTLTFKLNASENQHMAFKYTLPEDSYALNFVIEQNGFEDIIQANGGGLRLDWNVDLYSQEKGRKNEIQYSGVYFKYDQDDVDDIRGKTGDETFRTPVKWLAYKDQFFASVIIAKDNFASGLTSVTTHGEEENSPYLSSIKSELIVPFEAGNYKTKEFQFFFGPTKYKTLSKYKDLDLKEMIPLGWGIFGWINKFVVIPIFNWLEGAINSYGLIILILTLIIKLALFPLTYKSYMSSAKMRVLKPQIDEINNKIPKEKSMERQKATMALYGKAGVSPLGGCLPMLLQMPILFAMFRFFPASIELRQESFLWATDLSSYDSILNLPWNIPMYGDHVSLFCLLMSATNIIYTRMNQEMTQSTNQMPGMKGMMYMMPVMFLVFFNNYASGLSYYYFVSTLITILQTLLIRRFVDEDAILAKLNANQKKTKKKSGFQARIEEMAKQQQAAQKKKKK